MNRGRTIICRTEREAAQNRVQRGTMQEYFCNGEIVLFYEYSDTTFQLAQNSQNLICIQSQSRITAKFGFKL